MKFFHEEYQVHIKILYTSDGVGGFVYVISNVLNGLLFFVISTNFTTITPLYPGNESE